MNLTSRTTYYFVVHLPFKPRSYHTPLLVTIGPYKYLLQVKNLLPTKSLNFPIGKAIEQVHFMALGFRNMGRNSLL
jgi:hypothetical protein